MNDVAIAAGASRRGGLQVALVGLGFSVVPLDTAVNIAFPDITGSFDLPIAMIQWVVICYVLTHAGLMLAFGRVGDIWGHGRVYRAGLLWSIAAFLLCAAAPSFNWLLFFRFLQGIGAGLIISCAPALVTGLYPEARRSRALGIFTLMFAIGSASGPLIGGFLVSQFGWPSVFWFRAPIALAALLFLRGLPTKGAGAANERFDIAGALLLAVGLTSLLLGINRAPRLREGEVLALALLLAAAASLAAFIWWEARASRPIVRIDLFRQPGFAAINLASAAMYLTTFSVMLLTPYYLARFTTFPWVLAGAVLATGFIAMAATSPLAGWLAARFPPQWLAACGALTIGTGLFLVGSWDAGTPPLWMATVLAIHGFGLALFQVSYMEIVLASSPLADRGVAGSLSMLTRTIGVVTAAALLTLIFHSIEAAAGEAGASADGAFLAAYHGTFRLAGGAAALIAAAIAWSSRRRS